MVDDFKDRAEFFLVYICEAHSVDGWQTDSNEAEGIRINQHTTLDERRDAAKLCAERLALRIPTLLDEMDNRACEAYSAWPERIYIVDPDGKIHFRGGPGPYEFDPGVARASLVDLLRAVDT